MALTKGFVRTAGTDAIDARMMDAAKVTRTNAGAVRSGVLWTSAASGNVVGSTATMNVIVVTADFVLSRGQTDGAVILSNSGSANVLLDTAPSANSRIDVVWVKQNDSEKGDADSSPVFGKTTGTAAASPSKPSVPAGALELATVVVPTGVTASNASGVVISNTFQYTALDGAPIRYRSEVEMRADSSATAGTLAFISDGAMFYKRASAWVRSDMDTFAIIQQQTRVSQNSGTTPITLGTSSPAAVTYDPVILPISGGVIGPIGMAGWYEVTGVVQWTTNASGTRYIELMQNDSSTNPPAADLRPGTSGSSQSTTTTMFINVGDYIKLKGYQDSGAALTYASRLTVRAVRF